MVSARKLYERLIADRRGLRFRDFQRMIEAFGFRLDRTRGSHHIYKHDRVPRMLNIQPLGSDAKRYQIDEFIGMIDNYGLRIDE